MADLVDLDVGTHVVELRGSGGDSSGQLRVDRAGRSWTLTLKALSGEWHGAASDLFSALRDLRVHLDEDDLVIGVNGARPECGVSGMLADMGEGRRAYVLTLPRTAAPPEIVRTLDAAPLGEVADVATQDDFKRRWLG